MASLDGEYPYARDFASVLESAQAGEGWATATLWLEYSPGVAAFLGARGSREPEDVTSDVFIAVFDQLPKFRGDEKQFRSFVYSIAYRRLVDELRRRSRRGEGAEYSAQTDTRSVPSAEDQAVDREAETSAMALLNSLPEDQRDVMILRIVGDLTIEQIAHVLGKRVGATKALQRRALENLRKKVDERRTPLNPSSDSGK